jgi:hypothetical protein
MLSEKLSLRGKIDLETYLAYVLFGLGVFVLGLIWFGYIVRM